MRTLSIRGALCFYLLQINVIFVVEIYMPEVLAFILFRLPLELLSNLLSKQLASKSLMEGVNRKVSIWLMMLLI